MLNALMDYVPKDERVITIEDSAELQVHNIENLVKLEARSATADGEHQVSIRDLIKSALRMRPDGRMIKKGRSKHDFKGFAVPHAFLQNVFYNLVSFLCREVVKII